MFKIFGLGFGFAFLLISKNAISTNDKFPIREIIDGCIVVYEQKVIDGRDFSEIAECIKTFNSTNGLTPNSPDVNSFYIFMGEITENFKNNHYSYAKSKAELIRAWQNTIEVNNIRTQQQQNLQNLENQRIENLRRIERQRRANELNDAYRRGEFNSNCFPSPANNYTCR